MWIQIYVWGYLSFSAWTLFYNVLVVVFWMIINVSNWLDFNHIEIPCRDKYMISLRRTASLKLSLTLRCFIMLYCPLLHHIWRIYLISILSWSHKPELFKKIKKIRNLSLTLIPHCRLLTINHLFGTALFHTLKNCSIMIGVRHLVKLDLWFPYYYKDNKDCAKIGIPSLIT